MRRLCLVFVFSSLLSPAFAESPVDSDKRLGESFDERLATEVFYDCTSTPSYLVIRAVDAIDDPVEAKVFVGAYADCEPLAKELRRHRGSFKVPGTAAVCAGTPTYLHRFVIQPAVYSWGSFKPGRFVKVKPQVYGSLADCRAYAKQLNGATPTKQ